MASASVPSFQPTRKLFPSEINSLAHRPGVNPIALCRFFRELDLTLSEAEQVEAAVLDDRARYWRISTFNAVLDGIQLAYETEAWRGRPR
jgi:hypothetical protein